MPRQGRRRVSDRTALPKPTETMSSNAATIMRERSTASESVKTSTTLSPTESEIATLAYQLWQDNGCPVGSDTRSFTDADASATKRSRKGHSCSTVQVSRPACPAIRSTSCLRKDCLIEANPSFRLTEQVLSRRLKIRKKW
jgi:hypothetical protein